MDFLLYFNLFDYLISLFVITFTILGIVRGFYQEFISMGIWITSIVVAWIFRYFPQDFISGIIVDEEMQEMFSFLLIFIIVFIFFRIIGKAIIKGINSMQKSIMDRMLGSFVGFSKGFLFIITIYLYHYYFNSPHDFPVLILTFRGTFKETAFSMQFCTTEDIAST